MKRRLLFSIFFSVLWFSSFAEQKPPGGGGGAGAGAAGAAGAGAGAAGATAGGGASVLGASQVQQGYHYKIRKNRYFTYIYKDKICKPTTYIKNDTLKEYYYTDIKGKKVKLFRYLKTCIDNDTVRTIIDTTIKNDDSDDAVIFDKLKKECCCQYYIIHRIIDTMVCRPKRDTVKVYDPYEKLKVSITQTAGDSGKLQLLINSGIKRQQFYAKMEDQEDSIIKLATLLKNQAITDTLDTLYTNRFNAHIDTLYRFKNYNLLYKPFKKLLGSRILFSLYYNLLYRLGYDITKLHGFKKTMTDEANLPSGQKLINLYYSYYPDSRILRPTKDDLVEQIQSQYQLHRHNFVHNSGYDTSRIIIENKDSIQNMYLLINNSTFLRTPVYYVKVPFSMRQFGALTIPFQYRIGYTRTHQDTVPNSFAASINLALYIGYVIGKTKFYYDNNRTVSSSATFLAFAGPTAVSLSASPPNTSPVITARNASTQAAVSTGAGISYNFKAFDLGLFIGIDIPIGAAAQNWYYASSITEHNGTFLRPWIGFGIGFNLPMITPAAIQSF